MNQNNETQTQRTERRYVRVYRTHRELVGGELVLDPWQVMMVAGPCDEQKLTQWGEPEMRGIALTGTDREALSQVTLREHWNVGGVFAHEYRTLVIEPGTTQEQLDCCGDGPYMSTRQLIIRHNRATTIRINDDRF